MPDLEFLVGLFLGILLGWITLWCYLTPDVGRFIGRILVALVRTVAAIGIALGLGLVVWGLLSRLLHEEMRSLDLIGNLSIRSSVEALAYGGGVLVFGITALVLSFLRRKHKGSAATDDGRQSPVSSSAGS